MNERGAAMTKIEAYEKKLIEAGIPKEGLEEYEKLLKRVRGNFLRLQHCYICASQFPLKRAQEGITLIQWGLEKFPDTWFPVYSAYCNIGTLYESMGNYSDAYAAYMKAIEALGEEHISYQQSLSGKLLWTLLHADNFQYSEQLEKHYAMFSKTNDFEKAFINNEFRLDVAEIVIYLWKGMKEEARAAYAKAITLTNPNIASRIQGILNKHRVKDSLKKTRECAEFLKNLKL